MNGEPSRVEDGPGLNRVAPKTVSDGPETWPEEVLKGRPNQPSSELCRLPSSRASLARGPSTPMLVDVLVVRDMESARVEKDAESEKPLKGEASLRRCWAAGVGLRD